MSTEQPERLDLNTMNVAEDRLAKLREDFPEVFRDGKVDFDALRRSLGNWVEPGKERFGLNWPGKADCMKVIQAPSVGTLLPMREESVDFDTTQNMIIEGDNLEVLKLLQKSYYGKVKMIYIDPPYNTGGEFIYPDRFQEGLQDYLKFSGQVDDEGFKVSTNTEAGGRYHTNWLNMIYPRLFLARNLLRDDGMIFVSIDDHEVHNLRELMNEVFGEENFVEEIVWKNKYGSGALTRGFANIHEYILCYSKMPISSIEAPLSEDAIAQYKLTDEKVGTRGGYITQPLATKSKDDRPNLRFPIIHKGKEIWPEKQWIWSKERVAEAQSRNELVINEKNGNFSVRVKQYLRNEDGTLRKGKPLSLMLGPFNQDGTQEVAELLGEDQFSFPKPVELVKHFISFTVNGDESKEGVYLDFFAGSGTTGHAVMKLNSEDGGNRKFILVQLPEKVEAADFPSISAITKARVGRAANALKSTPKRDDLFSDAASVQDFGFRSYKLTTSNFKPWQGEADSIVSVEEQLEAFADHVLDERTAEDILTEILLKAGFELTTPMKRLSLAGKEVYSVAEGALLVCLDRQLTLEVIEAMIDQKPSQIICLDAGFQNNDQLKVNAVQAIKSRARSEESTIVFKVV